MGTSCEMHLFTIITDQCAFSNILVHCHCWSFTVSIVITLQINCCLWSGCVDIQYQFNERPSRVQAVACFACNYQCIANQISNPIPDQRYSSLFFCSVPWKPPTFLAFTKDHVRFWCASFVIVLLRCTKITFGSKQYLSGLLLLVQP